MSDYAKDKPFTPRNFFDELTTRIEEPEKPRKKDDTADLIKFIAGDKFMETVFPDQEWLVEGVLPDRGMVCLSGMPSSYKSWFGFYLALCILRGSSVLEEPIKGRPGWKTDKGAVLFIDKENIEKQIQQRMTMLGAGAEMKNCYFAQGDFTTENLHSVAEIVRFVKEKKIRLVIIDSLIRVHARNENDAVEMNRVFERLAEIQRAGATVLYLHHLRKATTFTQDPMERLRGSIDISARLDSLIAFEKEPGFKNKIKIVHGKCRYGEGFAPFTVLFEVDQNNRAYFNFDKEVDFEEEKQMNCYTAVLSLIKHNSFTRLQLMEKLSTQYSAGAIDKAVGDLTRENEIEKHNVGREVIYSINKLKAYVQEKIAEEEEKEAN